MTKLVNADLSTVSCRFKWIRCRSPKEVSIWRPCSLWAAWLSHRFIIRSEWTGSASSTGVAAPSVIQQSLLTIAINFLSLKLQIIIFSKSFTVFLYMDVLVLWFFYNISSCILIYKLITLVIFGVTMTPKLG